MPDSPVINDSDEFIPMPTPGGVIRQEAAEELTPVPFQFSDIRALAARILKRAQEQAQQKLDAARSQIAAMEKEASEKAYKEAFPKGEADGFAKGKKEGKAAGEAEVKKAIETEKANFQANTAPTTSLLEQMAAIINEHRQELAAQAEADLLLLAMDIAKRLLGHELSINADAIKPLANEAIGLVTDRTSVQMRINPEDYRILHEEIPNLKNIFPDLGALHLEADATIERGGLIAATREAEVDMRLATRLAAFEEAILGFSGKEAEAPWAKIDPDEAAKELAAMEKAKQAAQTSQFALPPAEEQANEEPPSETLGDTAAETRPGQEAAPEKAEKEPENTAPADEAPETVSEDNADPKLENNSETAPEKQG